MDITVTFPPGRHGPLALVRMKQAGQKPEYRSLPLSGTLAEELPSLLDFIWSHVTGPCSMQRWLFEA